MSHPRIRFTVCLMHAALLSISGSIGSRSCLSADIPLWPLLRIETPNDGTGSDVDLLWPIFELDTTKLEPAFALRPLVSYDANSKAGTFLFPIGWFGSEHFILAPILWSNRGHAPHFLLPPIYGRWKGHETGYVVGPGLFLQSTGPEGEKKGSLLPPFFRIESHDGSDQRNFILNYYHRRGDVRNDTALFPFFWWRSGRSQEPDRQWTNREIYPFFGIRQVSDARGEIGRRFWILWPLFEKSDTRDGYSRNLLGYAIQWGKDGEEKWQAALPFYFVKHSNEKHTFALPILGLFTHSSRDSGKARWLAWPFAGHSKGPESEAWSYLSGLIRYRVSEAAKSKKIAAPWPLAQWESSPTETRHRFWPIYRFAKQKKPETKKEFYALAELIGYREGERLDGGFRFLLRPVTFQQAASGETRFRFLWKLVETRTTEEHRIWAVNPLFYSRTGGGSKRWDFMGGLFGIDKQRHQTFARAFWFLKFPLRHSH